MNDWKIVKKGKTTTLSQEAADKVTLYAFTDCQDEDDDFHTCSAVMKKSDLTGNHKKLWEMGKKGELTADEMRDMAEDVAWYDVTIADLVLSMLEEIGALEAYNAFGNELDEFVKG